MNCPACERAEHVPTTGIFQANCLKCEARAVAQSPEAHKRESDGGEAVIAVMRKLWPLEADYRKGRALVWQFINREKEKV